ncbi:hypothetical protein [Aminobacter aminovorans]|uniref:Uncharacterized protein n=1 Tax=Aminobacter aminovorans TaxID=83263 RepID=A0AAC8YN14_AMIAI|nr:hypothetical protein [Aminobacter aminovorans]AMS41168.1 hypothetical protein AA2016_2239 [Aminobacter aminovorans]MBB3705850.1 hypothetical protein [Aminobacter aminovorans]
MNQHILEKLQIAAGFVPVSMATAPTEDWVSLKNYGRMTVVFFKAAGTAGDDPTLTLEQATAVAGTGAKALNFTRIDVKQGADLFAVGQFTTVTQAAANTYTDATSAEVQAIWVLDVEAEDLDVDGGFDCIRASISDVGTNAQLGCMLYLGHEPRYAQAPMPSMISD